MKKSKMPVFTIILLANTFILLCLSFISYISYNNSKQKLINIKVNSSIISQQVFLADWEQSIKRTKNILFSQSFMANVSLLSTYESKNMDYTTLKLEQAMENQLYLLKNSTLYFDFAKANFKIWGKTICSENGLTDLNNEYFENIQMPTSSNGAGLVFYKDSYYITNVVKNEYEPLSSIIIKINNNYVNQWIKNIDNSPFSSQFVVDDKTSEIPFYNISEQFIIDPTKFIKENNKNTSIIQDIDGEKFIIIKTSSNYLGFTVVNAVPLSEVLSDIKPFKNILFTFILVSVSFTLIFFLLLNLILGSPMRKLVKAFKCVEDGDFKVRLQENNLNDFAIIYSSFNKMMEKSEHLISTVYNSTILMQKAQLKQYQAQINPHFLYNTFYILKRMIQMDDNENAEILASYLGNYFKYITNNNADSISLKQEYDHAITYLKIMSMRLGENLKLKIMQLDSDYYNITVPRMILQPILENVFEYAFTDLTKDYECEIGFFANSEFLSIYILDNGKGISEYDLLVINKRLNGEIVDINKVSALENISKRLTLTFGETSKIKVEMNDNLIGTKITIEIPLKKGCDISGL